MHDVRRPIEFVLALLAITSGTLAGISIESTSLTVIAIFGALFGYLVTDVYRLFRLDGWLANATSLIVLYLVWQEFAPGDQAQKLVAVARMLIYLQVILLFQPKTPRLVWQVMVLSLLQVVIAAIFSVNFEAGMLFLLYFVIAGIAMVLQTIHISETEIRLRTRHAARRLAMSAAGRTVQRLADGVAVPGESPRSDRSLQPIVVSDVARHPLRMWDRRFVQLGLWLPVALVFAAVMFCMVPRHTRPWYGPAVHEVSTAGMMSSVDLNQRDKITLSDAPVFRATFKDLRTGKTLTRLKAPYFRGMAFSDVNVRDGKTVFLAPYDRIYTGVYQAIPGFDTKERRVRQTITLEKTSDPLVYEVMPVFRTQRTPEELEFCHEISTYTRCREQEKISVAPYKYETGTLLDSQGRFLTSWPYVSNTGRYQQKPLADDPGQCKWLTKIDRWRYPGLVRKANEIAARFDANRAAESNAASKGDADGPESIHRLLALPERMRSYFETSGDFRYTLDFRNVDHNDSIDPIEDFFSNHKSGHCELYAAALTLMLRSQDIPARLVVGFYGSEYNPLTENFLVRGTHAHAWVEVYIPPEACTPQMVADGAAGPGGAWKILDPTPTGSNTSPANNNGTAIELARSVWQEYVLGMETESRNAGTPPAVSRTLIWLVEAMDVEKIGDSFERAREISYSRTAQVALVLVIATAFLIRIFGKKLWSLVATAPKRSFSGKSTTTSRIRSFVARALSIVSPGLGEWVRTVGTGGRSTAFYDEMLDLLAQRGVEPAENGTARMFARRVDQQFMNHPRQSSIGLVVHRLTEYFNDVRFGDRKLNETDQHQIEDHLKLLRVSLDG